MKKLTKLLGLALALMALIAIAVPPSARAQVSATSIVGATTNTFTLGGSSSTNISALGRPIEVSQGRGIALATLYTGGSSIYTTGLVALYFSQSVDGTNYTTETGKMIRVDITPNGATAVVGYTNIPASVLDNLRYVKLHTVTNAMTATNMSASLSCLVGRR